jgi:sorting nexin-1/2
MIASCEENTGLARTLSKLAETHESLSVVEKHEADMDSQLLLEVLQEHLQLTQVLKELFHARVKTWQQRQTAQQSLTKKRENKARYDLSGNTDRSQQSKADLDDHQQRLDVMEKEFIKMSEMIRSEFAHVSKERRRDIKEAFIDRLESLAESEQQVAFDWNNHVLILRLFRYSTTGRSLLRKSKT